MLDFYVKVKEAQAKSKASLKVGPRKLQKEWKDLPSEEGVPLAQKEDFPWTWKRRSAFFKPCAG